LKRPFPRLLGSDDEPVTPIRMMAMWKEAVKYESNQPAKRGFGGRLYFYDEQGGDPVKVDGSLVVYGFDETGRAAGDSRPDRKFVFPQDLLEKHYSKSDLGHSYSIYLPWDVAKGPQKEVSLIVHFLPAEGSRVSSRLTKHLLPGETTPAGQNHAAVAHESHPAANGERAVFQTSYEAPVAPAVMPNGVGTQIPYQQQPQVAPGAPPRQMSTTTIAVPAGFGAGRNAAPPASRAAGQQPATNGAPQSGAVWNGMPYPQPMAQPQPTAYPAANSAWQGPPPPATPQPRGRFVRTRSRPLGGPIARISRDRGSWQPRPVMSPSPVHQPQRLPPMGPEYGGSPTAAGPAPFQWR